MQDTSQPFVHPFVHRILSRLLTAETEEPDPWLRDDLAIARLTVTYAARGAAVECSPQVLASYAVLGLHPEKVWPAIEARRLALGPLHEIVSDAPPKKPAQSAKLWAENTKGARAVNSRASEAILHESREPMSAIAALYPNSEAQHSAKARDFSLAELKLIVGYSGAPGSICSLTISALRARGEWPHQDGPATTLLSVAIIGMMLEGTCCRRTVQRRIKRAVQLGYWKRLRDANSWTNCPQCRAERQAAKCEKCGYRGRSRDPKGKWTGEFMRVPQYEFDVQKFRSAPRCREIRHFDARAYAEYKEAAKRGEHNVTEMPARKPAQPAPDPKAPAPAAPLPPRQKPAAEHERHRGTERAVQPKLSKSESAKFIADMVQAIHDSANRRTRAAPRPDCFQCQGKGAYEHKGHPGQMLDCSCASRTGPKLTWREALAVVCARWQRTEQSVIEALKFWGHQTEDEA